MTKIDSSKEFELEKRTPAEREQYFYDKIKAGEMSIHNFRLFLGVEKMRASQKLVRETRIEELQRLYDTVGEEIDAGVPDELAWRTACLQRLEDLKAELQNGGAE